MSQAVQVPSHIVQGFRHVTVAAVADVLWSDGIAAHMSSEIRPVFPVRIAGPAVTVQEEPTTERVPPHHMFEAADTAAPGSVIVIAIDGYKEVATWGGLATAACKVRGVEATVLDGGCRDIDEIDVLYHYPVFARSFSPGTTIGRFKTVAINVPVVCGGMTVNPGDIVVGDRDGLVVVPAEKAEDILQRAIETDRKEREQMRVILQLGSVREGIARYQQY
jgi:4-hydroxy-4-methyl-2-oxoglutarate aldolase